MKNPRQTLSAAALAVFTALPLNVFSQFSDTGEDPGDPSAMRDTPIERTGGFEFNVGPSFPLGEGSDLMNTGFSIGFVPKYRINRNTALGLFVQFNRWGVDEGAVLKEMERELGPKPPDVSFSATGGTTYLAVAPTLQLQSYNPSGPNVYAGFGLGFYLGNSSITMSVGGVSSSADTSVGDPGMPFYAGLRFPVTSTANFLLSICYNVVLSDGESTTFIDPRIGFSF